MRRTAPTRCIKMYAQARNALFVCFIVPCGAALAQTVGGPGAPALQTQAEQELAPGQVVLDRAVAVVNKHVILESDLHGEMRISILEPNGGLEPNTGGEPTPQQALQQALERLISRNLIEQQISEEDIESIEPSQEDVNARVEELRKVLPVCVNASCATDAGWKAFLKAHGLTENDVDAYIRQRLELLGFIERRFRQGIQISQQQIETYYHGTLLPQYKPGDKVPALDEVAPRIEEILLQQQVNAMLDDWLKNLRQQGDVEVLDPALESNDSPDAAGRGEP